MSLESTSLETPQSDEPADKRSGDPDATGDPDSTGEDPLKRAGPVAKPELVVRRTAPEDFVWIERLCQRVYPGQSAWTSKCLAAQRKAFPDGQLVVANEGTGEVVGMVATLIVDFADYDLCDNYVSMTGAGLFENHYPAGDTLYGAEVMVDPRQRRQGVGRKLYGARKRLAQRLGLPFIRAGARLPGYGRYAQSMSAEGYVRKVVRGELSDPTLSFQLSLGFHVIGVAPRYAAADKQSFGYAAVIEWENPAFLEESGPRTPLWAAELPVPALRARAG